MRFCLRNTLVIVSFGSGEVHKLPSLNPNENETLNSREPLAVRTTARCPRRVSRCGNRYVAAVVVCVGEHEKRVYVDPVYA